MNDDRRTPRPAPSELDPVIIHQAIFEGSRPAFARLYNHYEGRVRYCVARAAFKAGRGGDVEELIQETWCRFLNKDRRLLKYYDASRGRFGSFVGWVAYQQAYDVLQRQRRRSLGELQSSGEELADDHAARFTAELVQSDLLQKLLDEVDATLREEDRVLLRECHLHERSLRDLARELGIPEGTLQKRNERLKDKLVKIVEELLPPAQPSSKASTVAASLGVALLILLWADEKEPETWTIDPPTTSQRH